MARDTQIEMGLDGADFLPYLASFERFVPRYLGWLQTRDAQGAQWLDGEREVTVHPPEWQGIAMHGVIDRVDRVQAGGRSCIQLIDYKTGSSTALQAKVKRPCEDTQLPFYAALVQHQEPSEFNGSELDAMYLALDDSQRIVEVPHPLVEHSAETLLSGLAHDLARLRAGAPLPALGEASACDYCDARGLCRRDHWGAVVAEQAQA
jgi:ATP-dependent helicase/nuclease subunit B